MKLAETVALRDHMKLFVKGFCDSMIAVKEVLPKRKGKFNQPDLVQDYLKSEDVLEAHDALNDILMLSKLPRILNIDKSKILKHCTSFNDFVEKGVAKKNEHDKKGIGMHTEFIFKYEN